MFRTTGLASVRWIGAPLPEKSKCPDLTFVVGPDCNTRMVNHYRTACQAAGIDASFILMADLEKSSKRSEIGFDMVLLGHGTPVDKGSDTAYSVVRNRDGSGGREVFELLSFLTDLADDIAERDPRPSRGGKPVNIYLTYCGGGILKDRMNPDHPLWKKMNLFIFGNTKISITNSGHLQLEPVIKLIGRFRRQNPGSPNAQRILAEIISVTGQCVTLLGGELNEPEVWHAPRDAATIEFERRLAVHYGRVLDAKLTGQNMEQSREKDEGLDSDLARKQTSY
jgi:hypothetical protein